MLRQWLENRWGRYTIFAVMIIALGIGGLWIARQARMRAAIEGFARTDGRVVISELRDKGNPGSGKWAKIAVSYTVDGRHYRASQAYGLPDQKKLSPAQLVARHPKGASMTVHYDPSDPSRASLTREVVVSTAVGATSLVLLATIALFLYARRIPIKR